MSKAHPEIFTRGELLLGAEGATVCGLGGEER